MPLESDRLPLESDRRIDYLGREVFDRAVSEAATVATQAVAKVHRRRLVAQTGVTTFFVAVSIALATALALKGAADSNARGLAQRNCHLVRDIATPLANFVNSDAHLRRAQAALSAKSTPIGRRFSKLLGTKNYVRAVRESNTLNAQTVRYWQQVVVPRLRIVAGADCLTLLR